MIRKSEEFLKKHFMHEDQINYERLISDITSAAQKKLIGNPSCLLMSPSYVNIISRELKCTRAIAVDAGGTHLRVALIEADEKGTLRLITQDKYLMREMCERKTAKAFFANLAMAVKKHDEFSDFVGLSFAYPGYVKNDGEMMIHSLAKEVVIDQIEKKGICEQLDEALQNIGARKKEIVAINDTAAALIGAGGAKAIYEYDSCVGLILGTGLNICYKENRENILKADYLNEGLFDIVNTEAGMFEADFGGDFDKLLDASSVIPKDHLFEKMISGKYLPELIYLCFEGAKKESVISKSFNLEKYKNMSGEELSALLAHEPGNEDEAILCDIAHSLTKRSAKLTASAICAFVLINKNARNALIVTEGSTVNKLFGFKEMLNEQIKAILLFEKGVTYDIISASDSVAKGAALAAIL